MKQPLGIVAQSDMLFHIGHLQGVGRAAQAFTLSASLLPCTLHCTPSPPPWDISRVGRTDRGVTLNARGLPLLTSHASSAVATALRPHSCRLHVSCRAAIRGLPPAANRWKYHPRTLLPSLAPIWPGRRVAPVSQVLAGSWQPSSGHSAGTGAGRATAAPPAALGSSEGQRLGGVHVHGGEGGAPLPELADRRGAGAVRHVLPMLRPVAARLPTAANAQREGLQWWKRCMCGSCRNSTVFTSGKGAGLLRLYRTWQGVKLFVRPWKRASAHIPREHGSKRGKHVACSSVMVRLWRTRSKPAAGDTRAAGCDSGSGSVLQ